MLVGLFVLIKGVICEGSVEVIMILRPNVGLSLASPLACRFIVEEGQYWPNKYLQTRDSTNN